MARLSACIFLWDPEDVAALRRAKEAELAAKKTGHTSERAIGARIARRELALHCRRRTRYMKTGTLKKGGVELCCYRCARGSTSLESFHLHLNRFIPGITYIRITNCHINKCGSNVLFFNQ